MVQSQHNHRAPQRAVLEAYASVTGATYAAKAGDRVVGVNRAGAVTVTLPSAEVRPGRIYTIKDESGAAATNNITVATEGSETIDGSATDVLATDYEAKTYYSDGSNWFELPLLAVGSHSLASHSSEAHSELSGVGTDDHHAGAHQAAHNSGGADPIKLDNLDAPEDNTDLDFSTSLHGLVPKGTNVGNFLKDDGSWAAPGGGLTLIGTAVASSSASLTITGLDSTYDTYLIAISDVVPATDGQALWMRVGDSGGVDSGSGEYAYHGQTLTDSAATYSAGNSTSSTKMIMTSGIGNVAGEGVGAVFWLHRPGDGTTEPIISGTWSAKDCGGSTVGGMSFGRRTAVITLDRVQTLFASGNIATGRLTVWGLAHA